MSVEDGRAGRAIGQERFGQGQMHVGGVASDTATSAFSRLCLCASAWLREPGTPETDISATRYSFLPDGRLVRRQTLRSSTRPLGISGSDLKLSRASKERRERKTIDSGEDATCPCSGAMCGCAEVGHCSLAHDDASVLIMRFGQPVTPYAPNTDGTRAWKQQRLLAVSGR